LLDVGHRGPNTPEDGSSDKTEDLQELEKQHGAQLLGLGAIALEMHQNDEMDAELLMSLAAEIARTEAELKLGRAGQAGPESG
jgi:uncharacterized small protein (DUF1192 family)